MLSKDLQNIKNDLSGCEIKLDEVQIKILYNSMKFYKGGVLPNELIKNKLDISYVDTKKLLTYLSSKGYLKPKFKVKCEHEILGGKFEVYDNFLDIPLTVCDRCPKGCMIANERIIVVFEVVEND